MRDPDGRLEFSEREVIRYISPNAPSLAFLHDGISERLSTEGRLVPFEFTDQYTVRHPRYKFVSYPFEWCDAQLAAAAAHTILIAKDVLQSGFEIKDASAWNVIFDGCMPAFCDHLSFEKISKKQWWAFGQFARHFILPLAISRRRGLNAYELFMIYRDGVPIDKARKFLGAARFIDRTVFLFAGRASKEGADYRVKESIAVQSDAYHGRILNLCEWMLGSNHYEGASDWHGYTGDRSHYTENESQLKRETVHRWMEHIAPEWVMDLGCNTGEFTQIAVDTGASVIAADLDHDCVQGVYAKFNGSRKVHPVILNLGDMLGGKGFAGCEFPGFMGRAESVADVVMMLALVHHLTISEGMAVEKIAEFSHQLTKKYLIIELIDCSDTMARFLADQRNRDISHLTVDKQLKAFSAYYDFIETINLSAHRKLVLMKRK